MPVETKKAAKSDSENDSLKSAKKEALNKKKENAENKDLNSVYRYFDIRLVKSEINAELEMNLVKYSSEMRLPGFRKGKVPTDVIRSKYGDGIRDEAIEKLIEKKTLKLIKDEKLQVISNPVVEKLDKDTPDEIKARVKVELLPEIKLPDLGKVNIKINKDEMKLEEFDEKVQIDALLENNKRKEPVENRGIKKGDQVHLTIQSQFSDTKRMMPKKESVITLDDNEQNDIKDLGTELLGKKNGEVFNIERKYDKNEKRKIWAGKKIVHFIEVKKIFEFKKPEFNAEFLKSIGMKDEKTFKDELKKSFDHQTSHVKEEKIIEFIRNKLIEITKFDVPESLVIKEVNRSAGQYSQMIMALPEEKRKEYIESLKESAEKSIKFSLILDEVVKKNDIKIENDELEKEYRKIAEANKIDIKDIRKYYFQKENKETLTNNLLSSKALNFLKEKIKITEV